jgi:hypothetical protein
MKAFFFLLKGGLVFSSLGFSCFAESLKFETVDRGNNSPIITTIKRHNAVIYQRVQKKIR